MASEDTLVEGRSLGFTSMYCLIALETIYPCSGDEAANQTLWRFAIGFFLYFPKHDRIYPCLIMTIPTLGLKECYLSAHND